MSCSSSPVWFINGASKGLGLALALHILQAEGGGRYRVVGSVRNKTDTATAPAVEQIEKAGGSVIEMDMTEPKASITSKVQAIGRIDFLINNAGYCILAACEDITDKEATAQFNTNFFGPMYTIQAALPGMRKQKSGTIVNMSSIAAKDPMAVCSVYSASKAALEAASESLAKELAAHNIRVLIVEPGNFRTNFVSAAAKASPDLASVPSYYDDTVGVVVRKLQTVHGKQIGDPSKAAERIFEAVTGQGLAGHLLAGNVLRLVLGKDALGRMKVSNNKFLHDLSLQKEVAGSTEFAS